MDCLGLQAVMILASVIVEQTLALLEIVDMLAALLVVNLHEMVPGCACLVCFLPCLISVKMVGHVANLLAFVVV